jgi:hypothetical protein
VLAAWLKRRRKNATKVAAVARMSFIESAERGPPFVLRRAA